MRQVILIGMALITGGCGARVMGGAPAPDVVVVDRSEHAPGRTARSIHVPPGHYPPPGQCRIWRLGVPPGRQSPPANCESLVRRVPRGAFLLYNGKAWDTEYDWRAQERRHAGSVPRVVLRIMASLGD